MENLFSKRVRSLGISLLMLSGCAVGPDFKEPEAPRIESYDQDGLPDAIDIDGKAFQNQRFLINESIPEDWWTLFNSDALNDLVMQGMKNSPTVQSAEAALLSAQNKLMAAVGSDYFPEVNANFSPKRLRTSGAGSGLTQFPPKVFSLQHASVDVSYILDVFGGLRRQVEAVEADVENQQYLLQAAYLTLASNIVTNVVTEASLREQVEARTRDIEASEKILAITQKQYDLGAVSKTDVLNAQNQLEQQRLTLPSLQQKLTQNRNALAVLVGELPGQKELPVFTFDALDLPHEIPVSLPSELVKQRPDIKSAEAQLHKASANIGVATANLFPKLTLTGSVGSESSRGRNLFSSAASIWSIGMQILQPIFKGGALLSLREAAIADYKNALAQYQQTVLQGFQNVANTLKALQNDAKSYEASKIAELAAFQTLEITQKQYDLGAVNFTTLLNIDRLYQQARAARAIAQAARYNDTAALFLSMGGGWWHASNKNSESEVEK
jgi:NodT family efflux transporter outer membrane factor (OMF) lipoprotein